MLAFSTLIKRSDGSSTWSNDALLKLPPELCDNKRLSDYLNISKPGWSNHEFGYKNYAIQCDNGDLFIFPALVIAGERSKKKKFEDSRPAYTMAQIELYGRQLVDFYEEQHRKTLEDFNLLVHDLRRLSTTIYHSAQEASDMLSSIEYLNLSVRDARTKIENIIGAQTLLKIRTDVLDYSGAQAEMDYSSVPIYRRVDKVIKSMSSFALTKNIKIYKVGVSYGESFGPDAFEVVAYTIIDNAIKYSPYNNDITIKFSESNGKIDVYINSLGPIIEDNEIEYIFDRGFRGINAKKSGNIGSGIGLFLAKKLICQFNGNITVRCSGRYVINKVIMADIEFLITVPKISMHA